MTIAHYFDKKIAFIGLIGVLGFYCLLFIYFMFSSAPENNTIPKEVLSFHAPKMVKKEKASQTEEMDEHSSEKHEDEKNAAPFEAYRLPHVVTQNPKLALVVKDFGLSKRISEKLMTMMPKTRHLYLTHTQTLKEIRQSR